MRALRQSPRDPTLTVHPTGFLSSSCTNWLSSNPESGLASVASATGMLKSMWTTCALSQREIRGRAHAWGGGGGRQAWPEGRWEAAHLDDLAQPGRLIGVADAQAIADAWEQGSDRQARGCHLSGTDTVGHQDCGVQAAASDRALSPRIGFGEDDTAGSPCRRAERSGPLGRSAGSACRAGRS